MQFFVLEHFHPFKRWVLSKHLRDPKEGFDFATPSSMHPIAWLGAWFVTIGAFVFFLYWILMWGIKSGGVVFDNWGYNFLIALVQDIFICQVRFSSFFLFFSFFLSLLLLLSFWWSFFRFFTAGGAHLHHLRRGDWCDPPAAKVHPPLPRRRRPVLSQRGAEGARR